MQISQVILIRKQTNFNAMYKFPHRRKNSRIQLFTQNVLEPQWKIVIKNMRGPIHTDKSSTPQQELKAIYQNIVCL